MKENGIKLGERYCLKARYWKGGDDTFLVVWIQRRHEKPTRFYNLNREYVYANQLTEIPCSEKKCPCH